MIPTGMIIIFILLLASFLAIVYIACVDKEEREIYERWKTWKKGHEEEKQMDQSYSELDNLSYQELMIRYQRSLEETIGDLKRQIRILLEGSKTLAEQSIELSKDNYRHMLWISCLEEEILALKGMPNDVVGARKALDDYLNQEDENR